MISAKIFSGKIGVGGGVKKAVIEGGANRWLVEGKVEKGEGKKTVEGKGKEEKVSVELKGAEIRKMEVAALVVENKGTKFIRELIRQVGLGNVLGFFEQCERLDDDWMVRVNEDNGTVVVVKSGKMIKSGERGIGEIIKYSKGEKNKWDIGKICEFGWNDEVVKSKSPGGMREAKEGEADMRISRFGVIGQQWVYRYLFNGFSEGVMKIEGKKGEAKIEEDEKERMVKRFFDLIYKVRGQGRLMDLLELWERRKLELGLRAKMKQNGMAPEKSEFFEKGLGCVLGDRMYDEMMETPRVFLGRVLGGEEMKLRIEEMRERVVVGGVSPMKGKKGIYWVIIKGERYLFKENEKDDMVNLGGDGAILSVDAVGGSKYFEMREVRAWLAYELSKVMGMEGYIPETKLVSCVCGDVVAKGFVMKAVEGERVYWGEEEKEVLIENGRLGQWLAAFGIKDVADEEGRERLRKIMGARRVEVRKDGWMMKKTVLRLEKSKEVLGCDEGIFVKQLVEIQILHALLGYVDGHWGNFLIEQKGKEIKVRIVDNDEAFSGQMGDLEKVMEYPDCETGVREMNINGVKKRMKKVYANSGVCLPKLPLVVGEGFAKRWLGKTRKDIEGVLDGYLAEDEVEAACKRLEQIQAHMRELIEMGRVVKDDDKGFGWEGGRRTVGRKKIVTKEVEGKVIEEEVMERGDYVKELLMEEGTSYYGRWVMNPQWSGFPGVRVVFVN